MQTTSRLAALLAGGLALAAAPLTAAPPADPARFLELAQLGERLAAPWDDTWISWANEGHNRLYRGGVTGPDPAGRTRTYTGCPDGDAACLTAFWNQAQRLGRNGRVTDLFLEGVNVVAWGVVSGSLRVGGGLAVYLTGSRLRAQDQGGSEEFARNDLGHPVSPLGREVREVVARTFPLPREELDRVPFQDVVRGAVALGWALRDHDAGPGAGPDRYRVREAARAILGHDRIYSGPITDVGTTCQGLTWQGCEGLSAASEGVLGAFLVTLERLGRTPGRTVDLRAALPAGAPVGPAPATGLLGN